MKRITERHIAVACGCLVNKAMTAEQIRRRYYPTYHLESVLREMRELCNEEGEEDKKYFSREPYRPDERLYEAGAPMKIYYL